MKMVLRYAHLSGEHLQRAAGNISVATYELRGWARLKVIQGGKGIKTALQD